MSYVMKQVLMCGVLMFSSYVTSQRVLDPSRPELLIASHPTFMAKQNTGKLWAAQIEMEHGETVSWTVQVKARDLERVRLNNNGLQVKSFQTDTEKIVCEEGMSEGFSASDTCTITYTWTPDSNDHSMTHMVSTQAYLPADDEDDNTIYEESIDLSIYIFVKEPQECAVMFTSGLKYKGGCAPGNTWHKTCEYSLVDAEGCENAQGTMTCVDGRWDEPSCLYTEATYWGKVETKKTVDTEEM